MTAHASLEYRSRSAGPTRRRCIWGAPTSRCTRRPEGGRMPRAFSGQRSTRPTRARLLHAREEAVECGWFARVSLELRGAVGSGGEAPFLQARRTCQAFVRARPFAPWGALGRV